jgi:hypothetical protein
MKLWFSKWRVRKKKGGEDLCVASEEKPKTGKQVLPYDLTDGSRAGRT